MPGGLIMKKRDESLAALPDPKVRALLSRLHGQADRETPKLVWRFASQGPRLLFGRKLPWDQLESRLDDAFIALDRTQGAFCYLLARAIGARRIVEFGTSYGISTIYLACAVRDNGGGLVIGTERVPGKVERAREHLREAGLEEYAEIRLGDALETLRDLEGPIDFMLNDGFPPYALPVLELVSPQLRPGAVVVADNVGAFKADHAEYLAHVRDPAHGFCSGLLGMNEGTELSVRLA
jgi:predicted O-methyltransferase YrrM